MGYWCGAYPPAALARTRGRHPPLTRFFLSRIGQQPGLHLHSIADSGLHLLEAYDWPGNVRQLQAVLFRAAVFSEQEALTAENFPQLSELLGDMEDRTESRQRGLGVMLYTDDGNLRPLEEIEADVIRLAIGHYRGRMTEVARRLKDRTFDAIASCQSSASTTPREISGPEARNPPDDLAFPIEADNSKWAFLNGYRRLHSRRS